MSTRKLESAKKNTNPDSNTVREKKALAEIADGVSDTRLVSGVVARGSRSGSGAARALAALKLLNGIAEAFLGLTEAALGVGVGSPGGRWHY